MKFVEQAVQMLEIAAKIEHGFAQAERGELTDGDEAFEQLRQRRDRRSNPDGLIPAYPGRD